MRFDVLQPNMKVSHAYPSGVGRQCIVCWRNCIAGHQTPWSLNNLLKAHSPHCSLAAMHKHLENNSGVFEWIWLLFALNTGFKPVSAPPPGQVSFAGRRGRAVKLHSMKHTHALLTWSSNHVLVGCEEHCCSQGCLHTSMVWWPLNEPSTASVTLVLPYNLVILHLFSGTRLCPKKWLEF